MRVTLPKVPPLKAATNGMESEKSDRRRNSEQTEYPMEVRQGKAVVHGSSTGGKRPSQAVGKPGKMIVVNMGRSPQPQPARGGTPAMGSNGKTQTNPFLNGAEKRPQYEVPPPQQINNVQEVVQRMNSGDWPIKIDDDRCSVKSNQGGKMGRTQMGQRHQEKAHNWETLQRNKPSKEQPDPIENMERTQSSLSRSREQKMEKCPVDDGKRLQRLKEEDGYRSDSSEPYEQHTSVSTDSAFASEDFPRDHQPGIPQNGSKSKTGAAKYMEIEAQKLLLYFKSHRMLLNYLGIGLTESLWHHISALPLRDVQISIVEVSYELL
ncbi:hypothetical protein ANCDUO_06342 [Ancylostoma duodenale]|uniref:Uncharacterized protein n=1 Tax=Ancylostoma duodenale TaxID=51022 RepID=A0A0C2D1Y2_9BILA|nr:hypothetical protein ANCDUO_06342 [Ancylostoma duodenale]